MKPHQEFSETSMPYPVSARQHEHMETVDMIRIHSYG